MTDSQKYTAFSLPFPGFRWPHLLRLTAEFLDQASWPQTDKWLAQYFREHKEFGRRDRAFYADAVYLLCRQAAAVLYAQQKYEREERISYANVWLQLSSLNPTDLWTWLVLLNTNDTQSLPKEADDVDGKDQLIRRLKDKKSDELAQVMQGWIPDWEAALIERAETSQWSEEQKQQWFDLQSKRAPLWTRCLPGQSARVIPHLENEGFKVLEQVGDALAVEGERGIYESKLWKEGVLEIQDFASQQIVQSLKICKGQHVWDACAGGGGKSMAIAAALNNSGSVVATDIREFKLAEVKRRAKRQQFHNIRTWAWDAEEAMRLPKPTAARGGFDVVLIDAPCSSSGTWRRNPDARWRLGTDTVAELHQLQLKILSQAAPAVKVGGLLAYATCSWFCDENEHVIAEFLEANPQFTLKEQQILGAPAADSDTMFVAKLERVE